MSTIKAKSKPRLDTDTPWKEIMDVYFEDFVAFCWPSKYSEIDWEKGYKSLDKEVKKITRNAPVGNRVADKVMEVWHKNGQKAAILVHIEIQGRQRKSEQDIGERMLVYRYRLRDLYNTPIASVVILIDNDPEWRPTSYKEEFWGSSLEVRFSVIKLLDYKARIPELEMSSNRFAPVILAQLAVLDKQDPQAKLATKIRLTRSLYLRGWTKDDILTLYRFIDWIMVLPSELEVEYQEAIEQFEEEEVNMGYITTAERLGIKKGIEQGIEQGRQEGVQQGESTFLLRLLERKFKIIPESYRQKIVHANPDILLTWGERVLESHALEDVFEA